MDFGFWILGFGFWILDLGFGFLGFGFWFLGFGFWILEFEIWVLDFGFWILEPKGLGLKFTGYNINRSRQRVIAEDESCKGFTLCSDVPKRLSDRSRAASRLGRARGLDFKV